MSCADLTLCPQTGLAYFGGTIMPRIQERLVCNGRTVEVHDSHVTRNGHGSHLGLPLRAKLFLKKILQKIFLKNLRCSKIQMAPDIGCNSFGQSHKAHSSARTHGGPYVRDTIWPILFVALCLCKPSLPRKCY